MSNTIHLRVVPRSNAEIDKVDDAQAMLQKSLPVVRKIVAYLEAKPLHALIAVALENALNFQEGGVLAALSSRMNYIETGLISVVCAIHNLIVALSVTALIVVTCGQVKALHHVFSRYWLHTVMAGCGIGISVLGVGSPILGIVATGGMLSVVIVRVRSAWRELQLPSRKKRMRIVRAFYAQHRGDLAQALTQLVASRRRVSKMIRRIDCALAEAQSLEELLKKCLQNGTHASAA
jgi:hypothetical protein